MTQQKKERILRKDLFDLSQEEREYWFQKAHDYFKNNKNVSKIKRKSPPWPLNDSPDISFHKVKIDINIPDDPNDPLKGYEIVAVPGRSGDLSINPNIHFYSMSLNSFDQLFKAKAIPKHPTIIQVNTTPKMYFRYFYNAVDSEWQLTRGTQLLQSYLEKNPMGNIEEDHKKPIIAQQLFPFFVDSTRYPNKHLLGFGTFGFVMKGYNASNQPIAIKTIKTIKINAGNLADNSDETEYQRGKQMGLTTGFKSQPWTKNPKVNKSYITMELAGEDLWYECSNSKRPLTQQLQTARQFTWLTHRLHTGRLTEDQQAYVHLDIKPENTVRDTHGQLRFIDPSNAVPIDNYNEEKIIKIQFKDREVVTVKPEGTSEYLPVINPHSPTKLEEVAQLKNPKTRDLWAVKVSVMATQSVGIFNPDVPNTLPQQFRDNFSIGEKSNSVKKTAIALTENQTALDLAMHCLALEAAVLQSPSIGLNTITNEQSIQYVANYATLDQLDEEAKNQLGHCFNLLDEIQGNASVPIEGQAAAAPALKEVERWVQQQKILMFNDITSMIQTQKQQNETLSPDDLNAIKVRLIDYTMLLTDLKTRTELLYQMSSSTLFTSDQIKPLWEGLQLYPDHSVTSKENQQLLNECLAGLQTIANAAVNNDDAFTKDYLSAHTQTFLHLLETTIYENTEDEDNLKRLHADIQTTCAAVTSPEMKEIRHHTQDLIFAKERTCVSDTSKKDIENKIETIQKTLNTIPLNDREKVFSNQSLTQHESLKAALNHPWSMSWGLGVFKFSALKMELKTLTDPQDSSNENLIPPTP